MNTSPYLRKIFSQVSTLKEIKDITPIEFEKFVGSLFEHRGYSVETTPVTGDPGVDLFLMKDAKRTIVQCKKYDGQVSASVIREFYGAMIHYEADEGYIVTTGMFTAPGIAWAANKPIVLVNGQELCEWMKIVRPPALNVPPPIINQMPPPMPKRYLWPIKRIAYTALGIILFAIFVLR
jgi:restriction system protein